jgi:predicted dehydrogenase
MNATLIEIDQAASHDIRTPLLGFVGLGWIGIKRLEAVLESDIGEVVALADPCEKLRARAEVLVPDALTFGSISDILAMELDGVVIATPNAFHASQSISALEMGISVFCQKPLGRNASEVRQIINVARRNNRLLGVDLSYRHLAGMRAVRDLIQSGSLGRIFAVDLVFHNAYGPGKSWFYEPSISGCGCVLDLAVHLVDATLWCLNTTVSGVSSRVFREGSRDGPADCVEDSAFAALDLGCGAVANLSCSWKRHAGKPAVIKFAFHGTEGGAVVRNVDGSFFDFCAHRFRGAESELIAAPADDDWQSGAIRQWVRDLQARPTFNAQVESQLAVAETLDAIYTAAQCTSSVGVSIPFE